MDQSTIEKVHFIIKQKMMVAYIKYIFVHLELDYLDEVDRKGVYQYLKIRPFDQ